MGVDFLENSFSPHSFCCVVFYVEDIMDQNFMKEKKILPLVISMSLPMVVSMATNSLYNIVDSYFVAKISEDAMTAISLVYPIQNLMTAIGVGFGVGLNAKIAYFLGAGAKEQADKAASTGMLLAATVIRLKRVRFRRSCKDTCFLSLAVRIHIWSVRSQLKNIIPEQRS